MTHARVPEVSIGNRFRGLRLLSCLWLSSLLACAGEVELTAFQVGPHHFQIALPPGWTAEKSSDSLVLVGSDGAEVAIRDFGPAGREYFQGQVAQAKELFESNRYSASRDYLQSLEIRRLFASNRRWDRVGPAWTQALMADDLRFFDRHRTREAYDKIEAVLETTPGMELTPWVRYEFRRLAAEVISLEESSRDGRAGVRVESRSGSPGDETAPTVAHGFYLNEDHILGLEANPEAVAVFPALLERLRFATDS